MTAAISGGAAWPPIMYGAAKGGHKRYQYAYCVVAAALAIGTLLPLWQNFVPAARKISDPVMRRRDDDVGSRGSGESRRGFGLFNRKTRTQFVERAGSNSSAPERNDSLGRIDTLERSNTLESNTHTANLEKASSET